MVSQVSALSSLTQASQANKLTEATKQKLEALGVDTTNIKTEAQGQALLAAVQKAQKAKNAQKTQQVQPPEQPQQSGSSSINAQEETIKAQAKELAKKVGLSVSTGDDISEILGKIATALANMRIQAINSPQMAKQIDKFQSEYDSLVSEVTSLQKAKQSSQGQLTGSLDAMALYNKVGLGLS